MNTQIKAIILAGGKSKRMGEDKSLLKYDNKFEQQIAIAKLCQSIGIETFISKGVDFINNQIENFDVIKDLENQRGPINGILAAFEKDQWSAWLVLACDLPFILKKTLISLVANRNPEKYATCIKLKENRHVEPLIAIYEPKIFPYLKQAITNNQFCPRIILENCPIQIFEIDDSSQVYNANTPEEKKYSESILRFTK